MKTIIAGSRTATFLQVQQAINACEWSSKITAVVSGKASGADMHGEAWAKTHGIPVIDFPADWKSYGKSAGPIRNAAMADAAQALIAVWDGESKGTKNMIHEAEKRGLIVFVFMMDLFGNEAMK